MFKNDLKECKPRSEELSRVEGNLTKCKNDLSNEKTNTANLKTTIDLERQSVGKSSGGKPCSFGTSEFIQSLLNLTNLQYNSSAETISTL